MSQIIRKKNTSSVMEIPTNERIKWFDLLKFFAIFLVLWGHCIQHLRSEESYFDPVFSFIYSFHMPLFMMISGFFSVKALKLNWRKALGGRFRQLILPIISADIILSVASIILGYGINAELLSWFWFLKSAFVCFAAYYIISKTGKYFWIVLLLALIASQATSYLKINAMFPCFVAGTVLCQFFHHFQRYSKTVFIISASIFLLLLIGWDMEKLGKSNSELLHNYSFKNFIIVFSYIRASILMIGLAGSMMFISLFQIASNSISSNKFTDSISYFGKYTLGIYVFQVFILEIILSQLIKFDHINRFIFDFLITPVIALCVGCLCIGIIFLIHKNKYLSFLFLGERIKKID